MGKMPKPNEALKDFFKDNDIYADVFNAAFFDGKQYFKGDDLSEGDTTFENSIEVGRQVIKIKRIRDIVRISKTGICFVILCLEEQDKINYTQPLREMIYDSLGYLEQVKSAVVSEDKTKWTADEYLSKIPKEYRLMPIISLVLYTGEEPWDGPKCLHDMLNIDEYLKKIVPDYSMFLIDLGHDTRYNFKNRKLRELSEILSSLYLGTDSNKEVGMDMLSMAGILTNDLKLYNAANEGADKGRREKMCRILDERDRKNEEKGIAIGEAKGIAMMLIRRLNKVGEVDATLQEKIMGVSDTEVLIKWFDDVDKYTSIQDFVQDMENA
ncbi:MAG: Rpn family recombination-promoting nuclease/putative transposase [Lachnospiraceae bacterium]|nr:Rpn family recombination-promoting nuclease/putative transposase [Lachnospiraceae bacterium]